MVCLEFLLNGVSEEDWLSRKPACVANSEAEA